METPNRITPHPPRPPWLLEALIGWLSESVCPEVASDLAERYANPFAYLRQALEALPPVVCHRLCRRVRGQGRGAARVLGVIWVVGVAGIVAFGGLPGRAGFASGLVFMPLLAAGYRCRLSAATGVRALDTGSGVWWTGASRRGADLVTVCSAATACAATGGHLSLPVGGAALAVLLSWTLLIGASLDRCLCRAEHSSGGA